MAHQRNMKELKMDFIERITLSPFEKYSRFGLFPWKFVFHILLVFLCTYQALKVVSIQDKHTRIQQQVFSTIYLQNDDGTSSYPYYSLSDFTDTFFDIMDQTETLNETLLQYSDIDQVEYKMDVYYSEMDPNNMRQITFEGDVDQFLSELESIPLHPQNYTEMKVFIQEVESMHLEISNLITYISMNQQGKMQSCLNWTVHIAYSFESFANVMSDLEAISHTCKIDGKESEEEMITAVHIGIMVVSLCSLLAAWKQVYDISKEYMVYKRSLKAEEDSRRKLKTEVDWKKNWDELGFFDKMKFFDFWFIIIVTGNFFQLFGALVACLDEVISVNLIIFEHKEILIGFGVMLAWITILRYLEYTSNLNIMTATLSKSWNNLIMFLLGVMPFFLGFVFLGQTIFWKYSKFEDTSSSVITLFSLLNGDIVNDTFLQTWAEGIIGQIYLIFFMILFYTAVQNVFVTIIMEGYEESIKEKEYKKMIEEKEEKEKANLYDNLINLSIEDEESLISNTSTSLTPEQQSGVNKLKINGKKIDKVLEEMNKIGLQIQSSELSFNEKQYLEGLLRDSLESIEHSVKLQIQEIDSH